MWTSVKMISTFFDNTLPVYLKEMQIVVLFFLDHLFWRCWSFIQYLQHICRICGYPSMNLEDRWKKCWTQNCILYVSYFQENSKKIIEVWNVMGYRILELICKKINYAKLEKCQIIFQGVIRDYTSVAFICILSISLVWYIRCSDRKMKKWLKPYGLPRLRSTIAQADLLMPKWSLNNKTTFFLTVAIWAIVK